MAAPVNAAPIKSKSEKIFICQISESGSGQRWYDRKVVIPNKRHKISAVEVSQPLSKQVHVLLDPEGEVELPRVAKIMHPTWQGISLGLSTKDLISCHAYEHIHTRSLHFRFFPFKLWKNRMKYGREEGLIFNFGYNRYDS